MPTPQMRIVLVDTDQSRRMSIEKNLSHLGYHRVLPLSSLKEFFVLLDNAIEAFDLVVIHEEIAQATGFNLDQVLRDCAFIKHSLIYKGAELQMGQSLFSTRHFVASGVPDRPVLAQVVGRIERQVASEFSRIVADA